MKKQLIDIGGEKWGQLMTDYHKKIDIVNKMKKIFGISPDAQSLNAERVVETLYTGKFKKSRQDIAKFYDEAFGTQLAEEAENIAFSSRLGRTGELPFIAADTQQSASLLGQASRATGIITGPRAATKLAIPAGEAISKPIEGALKAGELLGRAAQPGALVTSGTVLREELARKTRGPLQDAIDRIEERRKGRREQGVLLP